MRGAVVPDDKLFLSRKAQRVEKSLSRDFVIAETRQRPAALLCDNQVPTRIHFPVSLVDADNVSRALYDVENNLALTQ